VQRAARPALIAAAAILLAGCGGEPAAPQSFGAKLQTATCADWREASPQQRQSAVDRLERTVAGPRKEGNTLRDDVAYSTLDARCKPDFARGFLLYELYIRAAGFESLSEDG
jgi:starvation-inducible outer membrane lipoprotein